MQTGCNQAELVFQGLECALSPLGRRDVTVGFEAQSITSDAGALLLREMDRKLGMSQLLAKAFVDRRDPSRTDHKLQELLCQRIYGIAMGYEDLNDHERLRLGPLLGVLVGKSDPEGASRRHKRDQGKPCAGKSTLNRLELSAQESADRDGRYHKISYVPEQIDELLLELFLRAWREVPAEIVLDLDATDDPCHGAQEGCFFHGYYDAYCYMPLYIFCGRHLLCARLRPSNIDGSKDWDKELPRIVGAIRKRWPKTRIIIRADSGFCREALMAWCEAQEGVDYVLGLARNQRLEKQIAPEMQQARALSQKQRESVRLWKELSYQTLDSWSQARRVVAKAEWLVGTDEGKANARFIVTSLKDDYLGGQQLYERLYCARGEMENRIKEQQQDMFADRTSTSYLRSNQLRLYFSSLAYVLVSALRREALGGTCLERASVGTIRTRLFKAGASVRTSVRRVYVSISKGWPMREVFVRALGKLASHGFA
jgi:hypothetical protein